jgi:hypothetical protein
MAIVTETLKTLVEDELARVADTRVMTHIRSLLIEPTPMLRDWDYGVEGQQYVCWNVLEHHPWSLRQTRGVQFRKWCKEAGLPPKVTAHSLRRGRSVELAHPGHSHEEINTAQGKARGSRLISAYLKDLGKRRIADLASARKRKEQS